ncbi:MAG: hypothetical protein GEV03_26795 [Streptosporangiales bacterium]|nr:hypothetical protein [Streptosporangiales bacterium]
MWGRDEPDAFACPFCRSSDQSQPVKAIVAGQTSHISDYGTSVGVGFAGGRVIPVAAAGRSFSTAQSPLAQMLDLPYPPRPGQKVGWGLLLIVPPLLLALFPGMLMSVTGTIDNSNPWLLSLFYLVMFSPLLIGCVVLIIQHGRDGRAWEQQIILWQHAMRVWVTLRYCYRDHVVYRCPDVSIPPEATRKFVYDQVMKPPIAYDSQR